MWYLLTQKCCLRSLKWKICVATNDPTLQFFQSWCWLSINPWLKTWVKWEYEKSPWQTILQNLFCSWYRYWIPLKIYLDDEAPRKYRLILILSKWYSVKIFVTSHCQKVFSSSCLNFLPACKAREEGDVQRKINIWPKTKQLDLLCKDSASLDLIVLALMHS